MPITLAPEEITTANEMINVLQKAVEVITVPPPSFNNGALSLRAYDAYVPPGERVARVPLVLNEPAKQTMVVRYLTANETAVENSHFVRTDGYAVFQPGEQLKLIPIVLKAELGSKRFKLQIGWPQNDRPITIADAVALISGDRTLLPNLYSGPALPKVSGVMSRPGNLDLVFQENFITNFAATDSGFRADGTPCWRTQLAHGRTQAGNKELGYYADYTENPGTQPFVVLNGKLNLQAEYLPSGVLDDQGQPILCPWDVENGVQQPFRFTASILSSQMNFNAIRRGTYVEGKMTMPVTQGCWPALWFMPKDWQSWPSIEIDSFEGFFHAYGTLAQVATTVHWKNAAGAHTMFSSKLPFLNIDITQPQVWGTYWGDDSVTFYCNDVPYMAVPNVFPDKDCFLMANIAVGGRVAEPIDPANTFPARMPMDWIKIWQ